MATEDAEEADAVPDERYGVAEELEPIDIEEETDAVTDTENLTYQPD